MEQEVIICGKKTLITNENFDHYFEINSIENFERFDDISCVKCFFVDKNDEFKCNNFFRCEIPVNCYYEIKDNGVSRGKKIKLIIK